MECNLEPSLEAMTSTLWDRAELIAKKARPQKPQPLELPSGGSVLMRIPTAKDYRDWHRFLRDEHGNVIQGRGQRSEELLVATLLVNPDGSLMFSREEVMNGAMDELLQLDMEAMANRAMELYGQRQGTRIVLDEDREKN